MMTKTEFTQDQIMLALVSACSAHEELLLAYYNYGTDIPMSSQWRAESAMKSLREAIKALGEPISEGASGQEGSASSASTSNAAERLEEAGSGVGTAPFTTPFDAAS